jgi:hypothetical protein
VAYGDDIVTGAGVGGLPEVKTFDGTTGGETLITDFLAFTPSFSGVSVSGPG